MQHFKEESVGFGDCLHMRKGKKGLSSKRREDKHIRFAFCRVNRFYSVTTDSGDRRLGMELSSSPACAEETGPFKGNWRQGEAGLRRVRGVAELEGPLPVNAPAQWAAPSYHSPLPQGLGDRGPALPMSVFQRKVSQVLEDTSEL